jgi:predicted acylesterase/phospholipase RssA
LVITIFQKRDLSRPRPEAKRALVLAGGAISGGAFKVGGLMALNRYLTNFSVTDFDIYMGISAGAFLAAPLSGGFEPEELYDALHGRSERLDRFRSLDFYLPNWREFLARPARLARDAASVTPWLLLRIAINMPKHRKELAALARTFINEPNLHNAEALIEPLAKEASRQSRGRYGGYIPSGLFDNSRIESYVRRNMERNGLPNNFRQMKLLTGKSLYIGATNLNTAQGVVFGHDEDASVSISEAVQASSAIPGFFKPARIGPEGREQDYCDAAVRKTANISTAVRHGASLIICYNPFRPFVNYRHRGIGDRHRSIADLGLYAILNQAFRTLLHSRLRLGIQKLQMSNDFQGDVILIEPTESDAQFFSVNPVAFWKLNEAAGHGFESVRSSLAKHHLTLEKILKAYGIEVDLSQLAGGIDERPVPESSASDRYADRQPHLRVVG